MMTSKANKLMASILLSGLLLSGCGWFGGSDDEPDSPDTDEETPVDGNGTEDPETDPEEETDPGEENGEDGSLVEQDLSVWFPMTEDTLLDYAGEGNEFAAFTRYPQFVKEETLQLVESTGGTEIVTLYAYSEEEVREVFKRPETYFREDFDDTGLESEQENFEIILQQPLEVGHSWESPSGSTSEITAVDVEKETPDGPVSAIEVTRTYSDESEIIEYYGEDIGLLERVFNSEGDENVITSTLSAVSEGTPEEFILNLYSLDDQAMGLDSNSVTLELFTNDPARLAIAEALKGQAPDTESAQVIADSVTINFMYLRQDGVVHADFSADLSDMNAGAGVEAMILQGIVNTIGDYYGVEEVLLTLDEEPYESGHLSFEEGETLSVDYTDVN